LTAGETAVLDVGALPGTDIYAPVDGTIVGISDYILNGRAYGSRIDIQPSAAPSLVVSLTHLSPDPALTVGSTIAASSTRRTTCSLRPPRIPCVRRADPAERRMRIGR